MDFRKSNVDFHRFWFKIDQIFKLTVRRAQKRVEPTDLIQLKIIQSRGTKNPDFQKFASEIQFIVRGFYRTFQIDNFADHFSWILPRNSVRSL